MPGGRVKGRFDEPLACKLPESQLHLRLIHRRGGADTDRLLTSAPLLRTMLRGWGGNFRAQPTFRYSIYDVERLGPQFPRSDPDR